MARSSTGRTDVKVDMSRWRQQLQESRLKFDDRMKVKYLEFLLDHGKKTLAARQCDIAYSTVCDHRENDPEFAAYENIILEERGNRIVRQLEEEALKGYEEDIVNKDGDVVGTRTKYETQLRAMILKRYDAEYKDRTDISFNGGAGAGVLVVPGALALDEVKDKGKQLREQMLQRQKEQEAEDAADD